MLTVTRRLALASKVSNLAAGTVMMCFRFDSICSAVSALLWVISAFTFHSYETGNGGSLLCNVLADAVSCPIFGELTRSPPQLLN